MKESTDHNDNLGRRSPSARQENSKVGSKIVNLTIPDIQSIIKNRYPILMLDRVDEIIEGKKASGFNNFTYNEWFFPGLLEGNPNVPGVIALEVLLEIFVMTFITMTECAGKETADVKVNNLHFIKKIIPGDRLDVIGNLKSFRFGVATGSAVGYVDGESACTCDLVVCVPDIVNQYKPK